jgi:hypothetical protein
MSRRIVAALVALLAGCSSASSSSFTSIDAEIADSGVIADAASDVDDSAMLDAGASDAETASDASKTAGCVATFGTACPAGYVRIDGTIVAVIAPGDMSCPRPNSDHVIVEMRVNGDVYRIVVNVLSTSGDPDVRFAQVQLPLLAPAFSEGFHTGLALDYPTNLGLHAGMAPFVTTPEAMLASEVIAKLEVGAKLAVYAQGTGGDSVHLVHRYGMNEDGALVVNPDAVAPTWLVFHFADQTF